MKEKKYEKIYNDLVKKINSDVFKENDRLPTENELSAQYGVSRSSSRRALQMLFDDGFIYRKTKLGSFVISKSDKEKKHVAVLCLEEESNNYKFLDAILENSPRYNFTIDVFFSNHNFEYENDIIKSITKDKYDGLIFFPSTDSENISALSRLIVDGFPIVLVDLPITGLNLPIVHSDNYNGVYSLIDYYIKKGYKKFAFASILKRMDYSTNERFKGFCAALLNNNLPIDEKYLFRSKYMDRNFHLETLEEKNKERAKNAEDILQQYLELDEKPEVLCFINDMSAAEFLTAANNKDLNVRSKTIVTGFDNLEDCESYNISTIIQNFYAMGKTALATLDKLIKGEPVCKEKIVKTKIVIK